MGKYHCTVTSIRYYPTLTDTNYEVRYLDFLSDTVFHNRIVVIDSSTTPFQLILPVNLYLDSTFKDTIWSTGWRYNGYFYDTDSIYFSRVTSLGHSSSVAAILWKEKTK